MRQRKPSQNRCLGYRQLFGSTPPRLGDAVRTAKQATGDPDVRRTWMLFGYPAMRLR